MSGRVLKAHRSYSKQIKTPMRRYSYMKLVIRVDEVLIEARYKVNRGDLVSKS